MPAGLKTKILTDKSVQMTLIDDATTWALKRYNDDTLFRGTTVEIGNVLYADRTSRCLKPGGDVIGSSASEVRSYSSVDFGKILQHHV